MMNNFDLLLCDLKLLSIYVTSWFCQHEIKPNYQIYISVWILDGLGLKSLWIQYSERPNRICTGTASLI